MMFFFSFRGATLEDREIVLSVSYGYHQIVQIRSQEFGRTVLKLIDTGVVRPSTRVRHTFVRQTYKFTCHVNYVE